MRVSIVAIVLLGFCDAVDIEIVGIAVYGEKYTGMIYNADTRSRDQSQAKIAKISASHDSNQDHKLVINLMLWDDNTKYMPIDIFIHFPSVETFHVIKPGQKMEAPINGHFINAKHLLKIFITNQKFGKMGSNVFEGCDNVRWIYLEQDLIESVDEATFRGLRTMKKLSLKSNLIHTIHRRTFVDLIELEYLNLNNNLLIRLSSDVFANNKLLKTILLGVNRLLYVESLELKAEAHDSIEMSDNLCTNENYHNSDSVNKDVGKLCTIEGTPSEMVEAYQKYIVNPQKCDIKDKDKILQLKDDIKRAEIEIKILQEENEKLNEVLLAVTTVEVCFSPNF